MRLPRRDPGFHPADEMQVLAIAAGERLRKIVTERLKHLRIPGRARNFERTETGRQHANHGERRFV